MPSIRFILDRHPMAVSWFHLGAGVTFCEAISLSFFFIFFSHLFFTPILKRYYELRGVIGRALASHAIDPGSNPGHAMLSFFKFV